MGILVLVVSGLIIILGVAQLVLFIMILIRLFKAKGALHGILGILCSLYTFIWGWMKHREQQITKLMTAWTACMLIPFLLQGVLFVMGMGGMFTEGLMGGKKQTASVQQQRPITRPKPQPPTLSDIDILAYGVYHVEVGGPKTRNIASERGSVANVKNYFIKQQTEFIQPQADMFIGFEYIPVGTPEGKTVKVTIRDVIYTDYASPDVPRTAKIKYESEMEKEVTLGKPEFVAFYFKDETDFVPGKWTYEIIYDGKKVAEQSFQVEPPKEIERKSIEDLMNAEPGGDDTDIDDILNEG